jgi:hypothetical protein
MPERTLSRAACRTISGATGLTRMVSFMHAST